MPAPLPIYPSFSLVITKAYLSVRPPAPRKKEGLVLPSRYHPYPRPARTDDDWLMTTVDYRFSSPPACSPALPSVAFHPMPSDVPTAMDEDTDDTSDDASDESHLAAMNNLEAAVRGPRRGLRRAPSLTNLVVDLALLIKQKCQRLVASGSGSRK